MIRFHFHPSFFMCFLLVIILSPSCLAFSDDFNTGYQPNWTFTYVPGCGYWCYPNLTSTPASIDSSQFTYTSMYKGYWMSMTHSVTGNPIANTVSVDIDLGVAGQNSNTAYVYFQNNATTDHYISFCVSDWYKTTEITSDMPNFVTVSLGTTIDYSGWYRFVITSSANAMHIRIYNSTLILINEQSFSYVPLVSPLNTIILKHIVSGGSGTYGFAGWDNVVVTEINYTGTNTIIFSNTTDWILSTSAINNTQEFVYVNTWIAGSPVIDPIGQYRINVYNPNSNLIYTLLPVKEFYFGSYPIQMQLYNWGFYSVDGYYRFDLVDIANALILNTSYLLVGNGTFIPPPTICEDDEICGYVYDTNGNILNDALVWIAGDWKYTNGLGYYNMSLPFNGEQFYNVSKDGYTSISGLQFFSLGEKYDWYLPLLQQGAYQYINFHVTGEGTAKIFKNDVLRGAIDNSHDLIDTFLINDTIGWTAIPDINQSFTKVCNAEGTICYTDSIKTITVTAHMQSQFNFIFTGVQKPNVYNITEINSIINTTKTLTDEISSYNYSVHKGILDMFLEPIYNMIPAKLWLFIILCWAVEGLFLLMRR